MTAVERATVEREIAASAEELFDAFLDPGKLAIWMRPGGVPRTTATVEPQVGGRFEIVMHASAGPIHHTGTYRAIERPCRLVFTWHSPATQQRETIVTVEFVTSGKSTRVIVTHERLPDREATRSHTGGWSDALALLSRQYGAEAGSR